MISWCQGEFGSFQVMTPFPQGRKGNLVKMLICKDLMLILVLPKKRSAFAKVHIYEMYYYMPSLFSFFTPSFNFRFSAPLAFYSLQKKIAFF